MNLISLLAEKPIAYHRPLVKKFGIVPGIFLGQILYWQGRGAKPEWIYKTQKEMQDETGLSRCNQETARKHLIAKGVLEEELRGIPATLHYRVNLKNLEKALGILSLRESSKLDCVNPANSDVGIPQTIHKITQENTTKDSRPVAEQVKLFREITGRYPRRILYPDVESMIGFSPDTHRLHESYKAWCARGYNPAAITWLEWYQNGIPPPTRMTQAEMNRGGNGLVL